jgi:hypothetical protein
MVAIEAITAARAAGYRTFVVGLATSGEPEYTAALGMMADAGGVPRMGEVKYYEANSGAELSKALVDIASRATTCLFALGGALPPAPDNVIVASDAKVKIQRDKNKQNGWDYTAGMKAIQIYGEECKKIESGTVEKVNIYYGCKPDDPIP